MDRCINHHPTIIPLDKCEKNWIIHRWLLKRWDHLVTCGRRKRQRQQEQKCRSYGTIALYYQQQKINKQEEFLSDVEIRNSNSSNKVIITMLPVLVKGKYVFFFFNVL